MQVVDIVFVVVAIFVALWLPLQAGLAGVPSAIDKIDESDLGSARPERRRRSSWEKLGFADAAAAHDIIQNKFDYTINWVALIIMVVVIIGYFVFLFRASDQEYREVIDEKFNDKK